MQGLSYLKLEKLVKKQSKHAMENLFRKEMPILLGKISKEIFEEEPKW